MKKFYFATVFICANLLVFGQAETNNLPADRPGQTMNASTLNAGLWQIQTGIEQGDFTKTSNYQGYATWGLPFDLRFGITNKLEIMASIKPTFAAQEGYYGGIEYSLMDYAGFLRYNIFDGEPYGSFAILGGYKYRSYEGGIANAKIGIAKILYRLPIGKRLQIATNLGYSYHNETGYDYTTASSSYFDYTANLAYSINPKFGLFAETYGRQGNFSESWFNGGLFWLPNPNLQLDLVYATGGSSAYQSYYTTLGLCYRFGRER